jgi:hypothetical protein
VPCVKTGRPGRNFKVAGLGVASVSMNMEFSQTSGSRPELARGTGSILKYDGETANGQAVSLAREIFTRGGRHHRFPIIVDRVVVKAVDFR